MLSLPVLKFRVSLDMPSLYVVQHQLRRIGRCVTRLLLGSEQRYTYRPVYVRRRRGQPDRLRWQKVEAAAAVHERTRRALEMRHGREITAQLVSEAS